MKKRKIVPGDPKVAIGYLRVSTDEQKMGPEVQRASIEKWAKKGDVKVVAWFTDKGVSGASEIEDRPGLVRALAAIGEHKAGVFYIAMRDRLAREASIKALIERDVQRAGASVISTDGVGNGDTPADQFMRTVMAGAAEYERALMLQRLRANIDLKKQRRLTVGKAPFGFQNKDGAVVEHPGEQRVVQMILRLREGGNSLRQIVATLQQKKVMGRSGPLALTQVVRILKQATKRTADATR